MINFALSDNRLDQGQCLDHLALSSRIFVITRVRLLSSRTPSSSRREEHDHRRKLRERLIVSTSEYIETEDILKRCFPPRSRVFLFPFLFRWSWDARVTTITNMINNY